MLSSIANAKRIVIKVGSSTILNDSVSFFQKITEDVLRLKTLGKQVIIVTSGAIATARALGFGGVSIQEKQALSSIGQVYMMKRYIEAFGNHALYIAQVLIDKEDFQNVSRRMNIRSTIEHACNLGVIVVINQNDASAVDEIKFGDNDTLSAMVAALLESDLLILLSDIDGLYTDNPQTNHDAKHIPFVTASNISNVAPMAGNAGSSVGTGGMVTKIEAAKIATASGVNMIITNGNNAELINDNKCTIFSADQAISEIKQSELINKINQHVTVHVKRFESDNSILCDNIIRIEGSFKRGDCLRVIEEASQKQLIGLCEYDITEFCEEPNIRTQKFIHGFNTCFFL